MSERTRSHAFRTGTAEHGMLARAEAHAPRAGALGVTMPVIAIGMWVMLTMLPLGCLAYTALQSGDAADSRVVSFDGPELLLRTLAWHACAAMLALIIAWPIGVKLAEAASAPSGAVRVSRGAVVALATALLAPWILFASWWTIFAPGNPLHDWLALHGFATLLRRTTLLLGLVGWCWAPAALVIAWWRFGDRSAVSVLDRLDGVRGVARFRSTLRRDASGLAIAFALIMLALGSDTVCFDLAQEPSIGFELRSLEAQGASSAVILRASAPMALTTLVFAGGMAALAWPRTRSMRTQTLARRVPTPSTAHPSRQRALMWAAPALLTALPLAALAWRVCSEPGAADFVALHGPGAVNTVLVALAAAAGGAMLALAHAEWGRSIGDHGTSARRTPPVPPWKLRANRAIEAFVIAAWGVTAAIPAASYAGAAAQSWGALPFGSTLVESPMVVVLGEMGRFGIVAVLIGAVVGRRWAARYRDINQLDGPSRALGSAMMVRRPLDVAAALGGAVALAALAAGEIAVATRLEPPGFEWLASSMLSAIHYQRPQSVMVAALAAAVVALIAALVLLATARRFRRVAPAMPAKLGLFVVFIALSLLPLASCRREDPESVRALPSPRTIGGPGVVDGTFERPRVMALDPTNGDLLVIDKTARVQRFDRSGAFQSSFRLPEWSVGQPVGATCAADGTLFVADTHYHRVIVYDRHGAEVRRFGHYGFEPGAFIYPTDVAIAPDGTLFVGEFGGNDRIQVFDSEGRFLRAFGAPGREVGAFERPQSLAFSRDGSELFVVDSCNHRIQVFDPEHGTVKRVLGEIGREPGQLAYPWAIEVLADGSLLIAEWGNERLQRLDPESGHSLGIFGGRGHEAGRLRLPWALAVDDDTVYVVDMGNNRVQALSLAEIMRTPRDGAPAR